MFDQIVKIGAIWDWVTPLLAFVQDWIYRPASHFRIPYGCGRSAWEIARFLRSKGIRVWGLLVVQDTILLSVREAQADYAAYWLRALAVPY